MARTTYKCSDKKSKKTKTKNRTERNETKKQDNELLTWKETPDSYIEYNPLERCPAEKWFLQEEAAEAVIYRVQNRQSTIKVVLFCSLRIFRIMQCGCQYTGWRFGFKF